MAVIVVFGICYAVKGLRWDSPRAKGQAVNQKEMEGEQEEAHEWGGHN
jgi:hypothetical protein